MSKPANSLRNARGEFRAQMSPSQIELVRVGYLADCRRDARSRMGVVALLLLGVGLTACLLISGAIFLSHYAH